MRSWQFCTFFLIQLACLLSIKTIGQEKRALLIGIDHYDIPEAEKANLESGRANFKTLSGAVNDVIALQSVLISHYGFAEKNLNSLLDSGATRDNILNSIGQLLLQSKKGDVAFIYYAGHGSQTLNSLSSEPDKRDETIIPADFWKKGVRDITDKELAKIFNDFISKGVKLTVIFDCCHSGSISRAPVLVTNSSRYMNESVYDTMDDSNPPDPGKRPGDLFLLMAACQDNEPADEIPDNNNIKHGAFTSALIDAINREDIAISADDLFAATRAILKSNGRKQEPVLAGSSIRRRQNIFGITNTAEAKILIPVIRKTISGIELQGGFAQNLSKGNELICPVQSKTRGITDTVKIRIDSVISISRSMASVLKGTSESIQPGQLFQISNWVLGTEPLLKIFIPTSTHSFPSVQKLNQLNKTLRTNLNKRWINELEKSDPDILLFFDDQLCYINEDGKEVKEIKNYTAATVLKATGTNTMFFNLPPPQILTEQLRSTFQKNRNIEIVDDPQEAQYILYGTTSASSVPSYGWLRSDPSAADSLVPMPVRTNYILLKDISSQSLSAISDSLYEYAARLAKLRAWARLNSPKHNSFPFHLEIIDEGRNTIINPPVLKLRDRVRVRIAPDSNFRNSRMTVYYTYVFIMDSKGNMVLVFPNESEGNSTNRLPQFKAGKPQEILSGVFDVTEPVGIDTYFLLASEEPIQGASHLLNQEGVQTNEYRNRKDDLYYLLNLGNETKTRSYRKFASNWSLKKMTVITTR